MMINIFSFGEYSAYVWVAYSVAGLIFVGQAFGLFFQKRRLRKALKRFMMKERHEC